MAKIIKIPGRFESTETGNIVAGANAILDDGKGKKQNVINQETDEAIAALGSGKQDVLTFDNTPTEGSDNPVKSGGVYTATFTLSQAIEAILLLIPAAASELNKLADKDFVNSSIATDTATFRGTSAPGLSEQQFLAWANTLTHDLNDYVFWNTVDSVGNTQFKRYKWNGTAWGYEYTLNNSSFTADQWAAITSGITQALVAKLSALPTATELQIALNEKQDALTFDNAPVAGSNNPVKSGGLYTTISPIQLAVENLTGRVTTAEGNISTNTSDIAVLQSLYQALTQSALVVGALPASGVADTIYRVPGTTSYSDYMWYNGAFVPLATYDNAIDDKPIISSDNLVKSDGIFREIHNVIGGSRVSKGGSGTAYYLNNYIELGSDFNFNLPYILNVINNGVNNAQILIAFTTQAAQTSESTIAQIDWVSVPVSDGEVSRTIIPSELPLTESAISQELTIEDARYIRFTVNRTASAVDVSYWISPFSKDIYDINKELVKINKNILSSSLITMRSDGNPPVVSIDKQNNTAIVKIHKRFRYGTTQSLYVGFLLNYDGTLKYNLDVDINTDEYTTFNLSESVPVLGIKIINGVGYFVASAEDNTGTNYDFAVAYFYNGILFTNTFLCNIIDSLDTRVSNLEENVSILPSYYFENGYIGDKIKKIQSVSLEDTTLNDAFVFFTDSHFSSNHNKTENIISYLVENSDVRRVIFGGDVCSIRQPINAFYKEISTFNKISARLASKCPLYLVKGNHDYYGRTDGGEGYNYPIKAVYNNIFRFMQNYSLLDNNNIGCYYYFDNDAAKIRYIIIDSHDGVLGQDNISAGQYRFIAGAVEDAPNYDYVIISHVGIVDGLVQDDGEKAAYQSLKNLVFAIQDKGTVTIGQDTFDFTSINGKILLYLNGHSHEDMQTYTNGILFVSTPCDAAYADYKKSWLHEYGNYPDKDAGTINEQTFDIFCVGRNTVNAVRIGGGGDRAFNLEKVVINQGEAETLTPVLSGNITWLSYNSTGSSVQNDEWVYQNTIVSVQNGVVNGLLPGEATVVAINENGDKEFWYIEVS